MNLCKEIWMPKEMENNMYLKESVLSILEDIPKDEERVIFAYYCCAIQLERLEEYMEIPCEKLERMIQNGLKRVLREIMCMQYMGITLCRTKTEKAINSLYEYQMENMI